MTQRPLTADEHAALRAYAAKHGRTWKQSLRWAWMEASEPGLLHALRNSHGPSWLNSYRLEPQAPLAVTTYAVTRTGRTWAVVAQDGTVVEGGFFHKPAADVARDAWEAGL